MSAQDKEQALSKLKGTLQKVASVSKSNPNVVPSAPALGTCYKMSVQEGKGLTWSQLSKLTAPTDLGLLSLPAPEQLEADLFQKVQDIQRHIATCTQLEVLSGYKCCYFLLNT